jgi:hypothetical protein
VLCLSASIFRHFLPLQDIETLPPISDVGAPMHYLESDVLIAANLAGTHASCRAVVLNATYRDFGTTHIPTALTSGVKTRVHLHGPRLNTVVSTMIPSITTATRGLGYSMF